MPVHLPNASLSLIVSEEDRVGLQKLSDTFVYNALKEYTDYYDTKKGVLDNKRWHVIKTRNHLTAYRDVRITSSERARLASKERVGSGVMTASTKLHGVLTVGTIEGQFNDMAFGMITGSKEMMLIKSSYTNDLVVDAKVLATIVEPTPTEPVRGMYLKWSLTTGGPVLLRRMIRPRDFVYLESTGILKVKSGERIGYCLVHSLQIPAICELTEHQIVRANTSFCILFRQLSSGKIELYIKGFVDPMGDVHPCIAASATADALLSFSKIVFCGQMKKLHWLWATRKTFMLASDCCVCAICMNVSCRPKTCEVCLNTICSRCSVAKKLSFLEPTTCQVYQRNVIFCVRCLLSAVKADALQIAAEEIRFQLSSFDINDLSVISVSSSKKVSLSSTNPPDATSEFFG